MKKSRFVSVAVSLFAVCVLLSSCVTHQVRKTVVDSFADAAVTMGEVAVSIGDYYVVEFPPIEKISADEQFEYVMIQRDDGLEECVSKSMGVVWQYAVDHKIYLNGEIPEKKGVSVKIDVEIRQKSTGKTLYAFDIDEDLSEPCGMMMMGKSDGGYSGYKEFDDGDYEFVITKFQAKKGRKYITVTEECYKVKFQNERILK